MQLMVSCSQIVQTELFDGDDTDGAGDVNDDDFADDDDIDAETVSELSINVLLFS